MGSYAEKEYNQNRSLTASPLLPKMNAQRLLAQTHKSDLKFGSGSVKWPTRQKKNSRTSRKEYIYLIEMTSAETCECNLRPPFDIQLSQMAGLAKQNKNRPYLSISDQNSDYRKRFSAKLAYFTATTVQQCSVWNRAQKLQVILGKEASRVLSSRQCKPKCRRTFCKLAIDSVEGRYFATVGCFCVSNEWFDVVSAGGGRQSFIAKIPPQDNKHKINYMLSTHFSGAFVDVLSVKTKTAACSKVKKVTLASIAVFLQYG